VEAVVVTAVPQQAGAAVRINGILDVGGGVSVPLSVGANSVSVQVTAQDGVTVATYSVTVLRASSLGVWRQRWFGTTSGTGNASNTADTYGTGLSNLVVYALLGPDQDPSRAHPGMLPPVQRVGGNYVYEFNAPPGVEGVVYGAEWTTDLKTGTWTSVPDTGTGVMHRFSVPETSGARVFMRLRVALP
jgi:hypothetical protein